MHVTVRLNNLRITARKSRQVADLVRGKTVTQAKMLLEFTVRRPSEPILKLLNSAVATATHDLKMNESELYISRLTVDEGPILKRMFPMSRGRGYPIMKRTSHITLVLSDKSGPQLPSKPEKENKKQPKEQPKEKLVAGKKPRKTNSKKVT